MMSYFKNPFASQKNEEDGSFNPSPFTLMVGVEKKSKYTKQNYDITYEGSKPILVVCTDESLLEMENKAKFSTGNHPIEMLVPMLHFKDAGFEFDIATATGGSVKLEMWAFPDKDENVKALYEELKPRLDQPKGLADIPSLEDYSAIFIPGGHGCMINLPFSKDLGRLLHEAHEKEMPTVTLCHGPATLLSTCAEGLGKDFAYGGYKMMCFTDKTDGFTPYVGYIPGKMPWNCQASIEKKGVTVLNKSETGAVTQDRELISGDSPTAANNIGKLAAPILVKYAIEHKM